MEHDYSSPGNPTQGKSQAVRAGGDFESAGSPGTKVAEPVAPASMASDEGYHDNSALMALCHERGIPYSGHYPENVEGSLSDGANSPTKGEGAVTPENY